MLNAEVPSVRHSVIGDLDHGEYDSVIHVHWNASARDLQGYVDHTLPSLLCITMILRVRREILKLLRSPTVASEPRFYALMLYARGEHK